MKFLKYVAPAILSAILMVLSQPVLACTMSPKGWSVVQINSALKLLSEMNVIKNVRIEADIVIVETLNNRNECQSQGFKVQEDGMCKFTATPDGAVRVCQ